ncbi:MAG: DUF4833 domain-containing protein [Sandaracinaceae bacterium]|nr:DUF4833 domain-containing protein [Sandaracinaceae bacterium]
MTRRPLFALLALGALLVAAVAHASPSFGVHDIATLFFIAKSDDHNRVDYGIHLDAQCRPVGRDPVFAYWRRFEPRQEPLGDLNLLDQTIYSVAHQEVRDDPADGSWIDLTLRALPSRPVQVHVRHVAARCVGAALTSIRGEEAILDHVFVQLGRAPGQIDHVLIRGEDRESGHPVSERVTQR